MGAVLDEVVEPSPAKAGTTRGCGARLPRQTSFSYEAECRWICGQSASPTGGAFAHIPTGTTANHRIDVDEEEERGDAITVAPGAIGASTEIGRATP